MKSKKIILGVCGAVAAYKACELARLLVKAGHTVMPVLTKSALEFITPLTFEALTHQKVWTDLFEKNQESQIGHIHLADSADLVVVAPASADFIAKIASGMASDMLSTTLLATKAKVLICPSMNVNMFNHALTQKNIQTLASVGYEILNPESGELACGWEGMGRLPEPQTIFEKIQALI